MNEAEEAKKDAMKAIWKSLAAFGLQLSGEREAANEVMGEVEELVKKWDGIKGGKVALKPEEEKWHV